MSLYSPSERPPNISNGVASMNDGTGTIDPAALTGNAVPPPTGVDSRGLKRGRSPEQYDDYGQGDDSARKRGRLSKTPRTSDDFTADQIGSLPTPSSQTSPDLLQTPSGKAYGAVPSSAPVQTSPPPKSTGGNSKLKALPTVRDHTSDQLNQEGDEYLPREVDDAGELKVDGNGYLRGGREYKLRTFTLPGRADKLFMLATECARTLQYRDSYLLFNKNRSLFKIIAQPKEKEELVARDILPYSYRSRQIAIVTARSMFRQFGSRVIKDGRRVRDDYWEAKARKQGFTEEDAAGEKRPGAARAREAAMEAAHAGRQFSAYSDIVYSNGPGLGAVQAAPLPPGFQSSMAPLQMVDAYDTKYRDVQRPRQDLTSPAYTDLTRTATDTELAGQSAHAADYSKNVNAQGRYRSNIVDSYWHRPHEPPVSTPQAPTAEPATSQAYASPRFPPNDLTAPPSSLLAAAQQTPSHGAMNPPTFSHPQNPMQSPVRQGSANPNFSRDPAHFTPQHAQFNRSGSNLSMSHAAGQPVMPFSAAGAGTGPFSPMNQQPQQSWGGPPNQPHQSPALGRMQTTQFSPNLGHGQIPSPMGSAAGHQSHSPHPPQMSNPQMGMMHQGQSQGQMAGQQLFGPGAGLQAMNPSYGGLGISGQRGMYGMGGQGANHFMPQQGNQPSSQQQQQQQQQQQPQNWQPNHSQGGQSWQPGFQ